MKKSKEDRENNTQETKEGENQAQGKVEIDKAEYEKLTTQAVELKELKEKLMRSAADYENAKKRLAKDKEEFLKFANEALIREFLPILDNLERAFLHANGTEVTLDSIKSGVDLIQKQIYDLLKNHGLEKIDALGKPFDPNIHEAVQQMPSDEYPEDTVMQEVEPGYMLKGRLFRPTKVIVSSGKVEK